MPSKYNSADRHSVTGFLRADGTAVFVQCAETSPLRRPVAGDQTASGQLQNWAL